MIRGGDMSSIGMSVIQWLLWIKGRELMVYTFRRIYFLQKNVFSGIK